MNAISDHSQSSASGTLQTLQSRSTYSGSSKAGSYSSSVEKTKDRDFTKDNVASPIDLECNIQVERFTKILDEAIYKTKLALCLPHLVQEYKTLSAVLSSDHMNDLVFIFEHYDSPLCSDSLLNMNAMDDIRAGNISLNNRLNPELGNLIYIMNSYPALKPKVVEMVAEMKSQNKKDKREPQPNLGYLEALETFREQVTNQMNTTAADEMLAQINTAKMEASNAKLIKKIEEYTNTLKNETERFEARMASKKGLIKKLENDLTIIAADSNNKLKKKILDSERQMVLVTRSHAVEMEMLKEEEQDCKEAYKTLLQRHLDHEQNQRLRKCKAETQLITWLQKYDIEMGDKQLEMDDITEKYDDEIKKIEDLETRIAEQDIEYIPLMAEREAEYQQEMAEKMTKFLKEHAARVIQHAWREVLANRAEKKKLSKQLKQKRAADKAARIAAEKAAALEAARKKKEAKAAKKKAKSRDVELNDDEIK